MKSDHPTKHIRFQNPEGAAQLIASVAAVKKAAGGYINDHEAVRRWILQGEPDIPEPQLRKLVGWYTANLRRARHSRLAGTA
jgi:hypothetical protein